jgi:predicted ATPase
MAILKRLSISGYKSIERADVELGPINVLIGANGAGKSNLIHFLRLLSHMSRVRLREFVAKSGGADSLLHYGAKRTPACEATIDLERLISTEEEARASSVAYSFRLNAVPPGSIVVDREAVRYNGDEPTRWHELARGLNESALCEGSEAAVSIGQMVQTFLWGIAIYHLNDTSAEARIRQPCYVDDNRKLDGAGANLAAIIYRLSKQSQQIPNFSYYKRIVDTIQQFAPWFRDYAVAPLELNNKSVQLDWHDSRSERLFGPHELPDGALRAMALTTLLLQPERYMPSLIVIDEPELGLHPAAINVIAALLKGASLRSQVIIATQSVTMLEEFDAGDVIVVDREDGRSTFTRQSPERLKEWLDEYTIGELWQKNSIGGGPL